MVDLNLLAWGLIPPFLWSLSNILDKVATDDFSLRPGALTAAATAVSVLVALPVAVVRFNLFSAPVMVGFLLTGAAYSSGLFLHMKSVKEGNISRVTAVYETAPVMVSILEAVFLGSVLTLTNYIGVVLAAIGAALSHLETSELEKIRPTQVMPFLTALAGAAIYSSTTVATEWLLNFGSFTDVFFWSRVGGLLILPGLLLHGRVRQEVLSLLGSGRQIGIVAASESLNTIALLAKTFALTLGTAAVVTTIGSTQPVMVVLLLLGLSAFMNRQYGDDLSRSGLVVKSISALMLAAGVYLAIT